MTKDLLFKDQDCPWYFSVGNGPIIATAIHNGHLVRSEINKMLAISEQDRLREEDPYTGDLAKIVDNNVIVNQSRFEFDLNRSRDTCIYNNIEESWGLKVYKKPLSAAMQHTSLKSYDLFYKQLYRLCMELKQRHNFFVVLDLHSYNHHRLGAAQPFDDPQQNPEINVGTGTMTAIEQWRPLIDTFIRDLHAFDFAGHNLDVRENIKFLGRNLAQWIHSNFSGHGCCLSIECKKFFMDEWTANLYRKQYKLIKQALSSTLPGIIFNLKLLHTK